MPGRRHPHAAGPLPSRARLARPSQPRAEQGKAQVAAPQQVRPSRQRRPHQLTVLPWFSGLSRIGARKWAVSSRGRAALSGHLKPHPSAPRAGDLARRQDNRYDWQSSQCIIDPPGPPVHVSCFFIRGLGTLVAVPLCGAHTAAFMLCSSPRHLDTPAPVRTALPAPPPRRGRSQSSGQSCCLLFRLCCGNGPHAVAHTRSRGTAASANESVTFGVGCFPSLCPPLPLLCTTIPSHVAQLRL